MGRRQACAGRLRVVMSRILVVDDNHAVRDVLRTILSRSGYETTAADGGRAALKLLGTEKVDLALIDIEMPDMSGYDVCTYIKTHPTWRRIPVVLMTGRAMAGVPEQVRAVGGAALVAKPFEREMLIDCIRSQLLETRADSPG